MRKVPSWHRHPCPPLLAAAITVQSQAFAQPPSASPLELSLIGSVQQSPEHTEYRALALLDVPLERIATPARATRKRDKSPSSGVSSEATTEPALATSELEQEAPPSASQRTELIPGSEPGAPQPTPRTPTASPSNATAFLAPTLTAKDHHAPKRAILRLVRETVNQGLIAQRYPEAEARYSSLEERSRSSALLPELRFRAQTSQDQALRLTPTDTDPFRYTQSGQNALIFEGRATFRLDRLVFADEELPIEKARAQSEKERVEFEQSLIRLVFEWQRARLKSTGSTVEDDELALEALKALEVEARLDALTSGWFSKNWEKFE
ncbi:MAG: hypothetical protein SFV15_18905 [Polyangiaceae bacterium]|nr:hypothetical protein [Polyangiaceae bacterium]